MQSPRPALILLISALMLSPLAAQESSPASINTPSAQASTNPPDSTRLVIVHKQPAIYPVAAVQERRQGQVLVKMHINESGDVTEAEALSGDEVFRESAVKAARKWKFEPYYHGGKAVAFNTTVPFDFYFNGSLRQDIPSDSAQNNSGDEPDPSLPSRVRISQGVSQGLLIHKISPVYPPVARQLGISGSVVLHAVIGKDGAIKGLKAISGPKELQQSAMDAVQQWRYKPYYLKSEPVEVETQITVNYTLSSTPGLYGMPSRRRP